MKTQEDFDKTFNSIIDIRYYDVINQGIPPGTLTFNSIIDILNELISILELTQLLLSILL